MSLQPVSAGDGGDGPLSPEDRLPAKRKTFAVPLVLAGLALGLGLSHIYVRKRRAGLALLCVAVIGFVLLASGQRVGLWLLATVWLTDLVGGLFGVVTYNRQLARAEDARAAARHRRPPRHLLN